MAGNTDILLQALNAFEAGNRRRGATLIDQILQRDFTHRGAWELLHQELGRSQGFDDFQRAFTEKYYPNHAYQLNLADPFPSVDDPPEMPYAPGTDGLPADDLGFTEPASTLRRVTIPRSKYFADRKLEHPKTTPLPEPYRLSSEPESNPAPTPENAKKPGFLARLFTRKKDASPPQAKPPRASRREKPAPLPPDLIPANLPTLASAPPAVEHMPRPPRPPEEKPAAPAPFTAAPARPKETPTSPRARPAQSPRPAPTPMPPASVNIPVAHGLRSSKIKVLVVDDIAQTRENIRRLLQLEANIQVIGLAASGQEGIDLALAHEPDVVLMDINMPDMDGLQATKLLHAHLPFTQVIMLTVQDDPDYMREALRSGARNFLVKPPGIDELFEAVNQASTMGKAERERHAPRTPVPGGPGIHLAGSPSGLPVNGRIITVFSPKGGTGRSMLAANLAVTLQTVDTPVLLVDCDLQFGTAAMQFNEQGRNTIADLAPRVSELDPSVVAEVVIRHAASGVHILAAPERPEHGASIRPESLTALLQYLRGLYPYVIVDTPANLNETTLAALEASDQILLLTTQDIPSLNSARKFLNVAPHIGVHPDSIAFVLTQYHSKINITPETISASLKRPIAAVIPFDYRLVVPSVNRGLPLMLDPAAKAQPIGRAFLDLAAKIRAAALV